MKRATPIAALALASFGARAAPGAEHDYNTKLYGKSFTKVYAS